MREDQPETFPIEPVDVVWPEPVTLPDPDLGVEEALAEAQAKLSALVEAMQQYRMQLDRQAQVPAAVSDEPAEVQFKAMLSPDESAEPPDNAPSETDPSAKQRMLRRLIGSSGQARDSADEANSWTEAAFSDSPPLPGVDATPEKPPLAALDEPELPDVDDTAREEPYPDQPAEELAEELPDLDPETAHKLKVLRRLAGSGKSDVELLSQIQTRSVSSGRPAKRKWWRRG